MREDPVVNHFLFYLNATRNIIEPASALNWQLTTDLAVLIIVYVCSACPGAVGVEAGCGGTLAPLGAPQDTAGMTFIRLVITQPVVATTVQLRLYRPRDSSNMGLLQVRLLVAPPFCGTAPTTAPLPTLVYTSLHPLLQTNSGTRHRDTTGMAVRKSKIVHRQTTSIHF